MKRHSALAAALLFAGLFQTPALASDSVSGYLETMNRLYEYAWSQEYPQETSYDICVEKNAPAADCIPAAVLGYQIMDYDQDNDAELLIVRRNEDTVFGDLIFQMYEVIDGTVVLQSELTAEEMAYIPEEGILKCYSYLDEEENRRIGCDLWTSACYLADGITTASKLLSYDGQELSVIDTALCSGSSFREHDISDEYARIGITDIDESALAAGRMTACQYLTASDLFVEYEQLVTIDSDTYFQWYQNPDSDPSCVIGTASVKKRCWLPVFEM